MPLWYSKPKREVGLTWALSTDGTPVSQNLYRGNTTGGPYSLLATLGPSVTSYIDIQVNPGQNYFYVITVVDATKGESAFSTESMVTVGGPP